MGNYSQQPEEALKEAQSKNYDKVRFQQGKPILDRELNLLGDLCGPSSLRSYLGNGVPGGSNGFEVAGVDFVNQNFTLADGEMVVDGHVIFTNGSSYKSQPFSVKPPGWPSTTNVLFVVLTIETKEITDADDPDLQNSSDIGFETTLREQVKWQVQVVTKFLISENTVLLAELDTKAKTVTDRRVTNMTLSTMRVDLNNVIKTNTTSLAQVNQALAPDGSLKDNIVSTSKIQDGAVTTPKLQDNSVSTLKLQDNSVSLTKLQDNSVSMTKLQDNSISNAKLQDNAVGTAELLNNAVSTAKLQDGAVTNTKLQDNSVTSIKLQDNAVSTPKLQDNSVSVAKLQDNSVTITKLQDNSVSTAKIQDNAVTTPKLQDNSVGPTKLQDNSVNMTKLQDNSVSMTKLQDNSISNAKLQDNAVGTAELLNNAVSTAKLQDGAVTAPKLGVDCITLNNMANGSVSGPKLRFSTLASSSTTLTAGQVKDILIMDNLPTTKQAFYFPIITVTATSGTTGMSVVEFQIIFKQVAGATVNQLLLRLKNTPTNSNSVDVLYRVDMFDPTE
jgi:hypothetical protein